MRFGRIAITIARDVSGMPGIAGRLTTSARIRLPHGEWGVPECWFRLVRDVRDEDWSIGYLWQS
jgi:1,4-alpha-glucan branching enzyme